MNKCETLTVNITTDQKKRLEQESNGPTRLSQSQIVRDALELWWTARENPNSPSEKEVLKIMFNDFKKDMLKVIRLGAKNNGKVEP